MNKIKRYRFTILFSAVFGFLASSLIPAAYVKYDELQPVVRMHGVLVSQSPESVVIHITGEKLRECQFLQLDSYYKTPTGVLVDANEVRADGPPTDGSSKPLGYFDLGLWRIFPLSEAVSVLMFVEHNCGGRVVLTQIADIPLAPISHLSPGSL